MRICSFLISAASITIASAWLPVTAHDAGIPGICPLVVHQEQRDLIEQELAVNLFAARLAAAESIFKLVDQLWQQEAIERILYLKAKHDRDVAQLRLKRERLVLRREEAEAEQFSLVCSSERSGETAADRKRRLDDARRAYLQADCHRIGEDLAIAEVDFAYDREFLASVKDLRENHVATAQDVIRAERDVEMSRERVEHQKPRVQACVDSGVAGGKGAPGKPGAPGG